MLLLHLVLALLEVLHGLHVVGGRWLRLSRGQARFRSLMLLLLLVLSRVILVLFAHRLPLRSARRWTLDIRTWFVPAPGLPTPVPRVQALAFSGQSPPYRHPGGFEGPRLECGAQNGGSSSRL